MISNQLAAIMKMYQDTSRKQDMTHQHFLKLEDHVKSLLQAIPILHGKAEAILDARNARFHKELTQKLDGVLRVFRPSENDSHMVVYGSGTAFLIGCANGIVLMLVCAVLLAFLLACQSLLRIVFNRYYFITS